MASRIMGSRFQPFSYAEMVRPLQESTAAQQQMEQAYDTMGAEASLVGSNLNEQLDSKAYQQHMKYQKDLEALSNQLSSDGLNAQSKQGLRTLRKNFMQNIVPMKRAVEQRNKRVEEQRQRQLNDPTYIIDNPESMTSIDDIMQNKAQPSRGVSGTVLQQQVAQSAQHLSKEIEDNPTRWRAILKGQNYELIKRNGFRPEDIMKVISQDPEASPILSNILNNVLVTAGVDKWTNDQAKQRAYQSAQMGLWSAVGGQSSQIVNNQDYISKLEQQRLDKAKTKVDADNNKREVDRNLYSTERYVPSVNKNENRVVQERDLDYIKTLIDKPLDMDKKIVEYIDEMEYHSADPQTGIMTAVPTGKKIKRTTISNRAKFDKIKKNYNITDEDPKEVYKKLQNIAKSRVFRNTSYAINVTDPTSIMKDINNSVMNRVSLKNHTGLNKLENGKKGDEIEKDEAFKYLGSNGELSINPELGIVISSTDSNGKMYSAVVDTELVDDAQQTYKNTLKDIRIAMSKGKMNLANSKMKALTKALYFKFNTKVMTQSKSSSKI